MKCKMVWSSKLVKSCLELLIKAKLVAVTEGYTGTQDVIVTGIATHVFLSRVILAAHDNCLYIIPRIFHDVVFSDCQVQYFVILLRGVYFHVDLLVKFCFHSRIFFSL